MQPYSRLKYRVLVVITTAVLLTAMILPLTAQAADVPGRSTDPSRTDQLQRIVNRMQPGWNLGNTFDAVGADETAWGNPRVTKELLQKIKQQGFRSIRIPVTWQPHMGNAPDYKIDPAFIDRVQQVVDWALDDGLYVVINMHHDSWLWVNQLSTNHDQVLARYTSVWKQIADQFKNEPDRLLFESINEQSFNGVDSNSAQAAQLQDELNTAFVHLVRQSGGNNTDRPLVLPGVGTSPSQAALDGLSSTISKLKDPNIIATFHYYGYWPFSVNIAGTTTFDQTTRQDLIDNFDRVHDRFVAKGIPVILGEYGLLGFDVNMHAVEQGEQQKFFEFLTYYARMKDITTMLWDNGQHFNRTTYEWNDPQLYEILKAGWRTRSSTAASDLVFVPYGKGIQDESVKLNLNGNRLVFLSADGKVLRQGKDYSLDSGTLTFRTDLLKNLLASGMPGANAVVTAHFNHGKDLLFQVILADTPVLKDATGTTDSFAIPADFNGDQVATMEAVYADGSGNAGPQNWTSYKQYGSDYLPSYDTNEIKLLPAFFKQVKDGTVTLKFHFWTGKVMTYTITKNGTSVTGTSS